MKKKLTITGDAGFHVALDEWARLTVEAERKSAALEAKLQTLRQPAEAELAALRAQCAELAAAAEDYAFTHRDRLLTADKKSAETALAEWGLRLDPPSVKQAGKSWPVARTVEALAEAGEANYLTVKTALNKDAIHADKAGDKEWLTRYGLRIAQDESFHLSVKRAVTQPES